VRICAVIKYPPIQGGVSARSYWIARSLAARGHQVSVVTNAAEVEDAYRIWIPPEDESRLEASFQNGGYVKVVSTGSFRKNLSHIPWANPFATKLAALATEEVRAAQAEILFSWYFEPYSLSASLAAHWTGVPHVVQHAGSDRTRLMSHPELSLAYREMLRHATKVVTGGPALRGLGLADDQVARVAVGFLPTEWFTSKALDVNALLQRLTAIKHPAIVNPRPLPEGQPIVGVYGKAGETKGTYDLIDALAEVRRRDCRFSLLTMGGGREWPKVRQRLRSAGLDDVTWTLPFLPHWRVPEFLRACTAVCFLERRFPVSIHTPGIPQEIMAAGVCAVMSREIANKQRFAQHLRHGENAFIVEDPSDISALAGILERVLSNPELARKVGNAGAQLVRVENEETLAKSYEQLFTAAIERHSRPVATGMPLEQDKAVLEFLKLHMPASMTVLVEEVSGWLAEFNRDRGADRNSTALDAYAFAEGMLRKIHAREQTPEYLAELVEFERLSLWLAVDLEGPTGIPAFPRVRRRSLYNGEHHEGHQDGHQDERQGSMLALRPLSSNWLRCREFRFDMNALQTTICRGEDGMPARDKQIYLFQKRGDLDKRVFRINACTQQLIALSDGKRTVRAIAGALGLESPSGLDVVCKKISELAKELVLTLV
jgi:glycosyltransferase involved in cell wall biosynthesis